MGPIRVVPWWWTPEFEEALPWIVGVALVLLTAVLLWYFGRGVVQAISRFIDRHRKPRVGDWVVVNNGTTMAFRAEVAGERVALDGRNRKYKVLQLRLVDGGCTEALAKHCRRLG